MQQLWSFLQRTARVQPGPTPALGWGAAVCAVYALLHVAYAGVVLDESVLPAQIIAGTTQYPSGHPHEVFYWRALSLSHYLSALIWVGLPDAVAVSAIRNWMFLFSSAYAVYAVAWLLTRRAVWAYTATALALLGAHLPFAGVYPMWMFPNYYSNGHLGLQLGLITVALFLAGCRGAPAFLLGLMPTIHGTLALPIWAWSAVYLALRHGPVRGLRFLGPWFAGGILVSVAVAIATLVLPPDWFPTEPFVGDGDPNAIRETFRQMTDVHRRPYPFAQPGYLGNLGALLGLGAVFWALLSGEPRDGPDRAARTAGAVGLAGLALVCWVITGGTWLTDAAGWLPTTAHLVMPGRFSNYTAVLLMPLTVAVAGAAMARTSPSDRVWAWLGVAGGMLLASALRFRLGTGPQAETAHWMVGFVGMGVSLGLAFSFAPDSRRTVAAAAAGIALAFGFIGAEGRAAAVFLAGGGLAVVGIGLARWATRAWAPRVAAAEPAAWLLVAVSLVVVATVALPGRIQDRVGGRHTRWDRISADDVEMRSWLRENAQPDELVLAFTLPRAEMQVKTGHPVVLELETLWIMTYMPTLAPAIARMTRDLYGVDYSRPETLATLCEDGLVGGYCEVWADVWKERPASEWRALSSHYGFRLVVSPNHVPLALTPVVAGTRFTLYRMD